MGKDESPRISVRLPKSVMAAMRKHLAAYPDETASSVVQDAVAKYLGVESPEMQPGGFAHMGPRKLKQMSRKGNEARRSGSDV